LSAFGEANVLVLERDSKVEGESPFNSKLILGEYRIIAFSLKRGSEVERVKDVFTLALENPHAEALESIWDDHLARLTFSLDAVGGVDGWNYYFGTNTRRIRPITGTVWSPPEESEIGALVRLAESVFQAVKAGKSEAIEDAVIKYDKGKNIKESPRQKPPGSVNKY
jgi:hypothetical protein